MTQAQRLMARNQVLQCSSIARAHGDINHGYADHWNHQAAWNLQLLGGMCGQW